MTPPKAPFSKSEEEAVQSVISNLVQGLSQQVNLDDDDDEIGAVPDMDDPEMINRFMENFMGTGMGGGGGGTRRNTDPNSLNPDAVIDGMMEQLLCKDLMYEPMKQVATKFPQWLEEKRSSLSPEEYSMYVCCLIT
jgi:peroxin-19